MRESMVFYKSFWEAINELDDADQLAALRSIIGYALDGEEPDGSGPAKAIFMMAKPQIDANEKRYQNGKGGGKKNKNVTKPEPNPNQNGTKPEPKPNQSLTKPEPNPNQNGTKPEPNENVNENVNVNVNDNEKEKESPSAIPKRKPTAFTPPTLEEVKAYCAERRNDVDPQRFVDFYASKGWKVGNQAMKDWRAAVRTWERSETARSGTTGARGAPVRKNGFVNFEQRPIDFDALMRKKQEDLTKIRGGKDREQSDLTGAADP